MAATGFADDSMPVSLAPPDLFKPRFPQSTYAGRARHFFATVNPANCFYSNETLERSRQMVVDYRSGKLSKEVTVGQLWRAKEIFDSAFHPETGEKMNILGRMSSQAREKTFMVPANMILNGGLLTFRTHFPSVIFWHWLNQSFNAVVNYTNRSGENAVSNQRLFASYCAATGSALAVAIGLNTRVKKAAGFGARLIPFAAVALANAVNIPMMRSKELESGIVLRDSAGAEVGKSRVAAAVAITQVTLSRISMAASTMVTTPLLMMAISNRRFYRTRPWLAAPIQTIIAGFTLTFATPLCCAFFPQTASIKVKYLESSTREAISKLPNAPEIVYYNKGL